MKTSSWTRVAAVVVPGVVILLSGIVLSAQPDDDPPLNVLKIGLGTGTVTGTGINCGVDCDQGFASTDTVTLTAAAGVNSTFMGWGGDCSGTAPCTLSMNVARSVTANFRLDLSIPTITDFTPEGPAGVGGIKQYLIDNPQVDTPARFIAALPRDFRQNWILMSRSESLQTGTAQSPRILLPSEDARFVFTIGMTTNSSYPGAHPLAIEYMQWDDVEKNFRFHEVILGSIGPMGPIGARTRGIGIDDDKCGKCHSTRNILNRTTFPGTTGTTPGLLKFKNKPNWDTYDSWGGMIPFNRDRIYQGSVEAAAFRHIFNLWNWRNSAANDDIRQILEQLELQPPHLGASSPHRIDRDMASVTDTGHIKFGFDPLAPIATSTVSNSYDFNGTTGSTSTVTQGGRYVTLRHSNSIPVPETANDNYSRPGADEGRGVQLFDLLGGADGNLNPQRIADELIDHQFATGSVRIDVRPIALAILNLPRCVSIDAAANTVTGTPPLTIDLDFFRLRHGLPVGQGINQIVVDTRDRAHSIPKRKADIQKLNLARTNDPYLRLTATDPGLIPQYGSGTAAGTDTATTRIRNDVFQRPIDLGRADRTVMGRIYVDRELYGSDPDITTPAYTDQNTDTVALLRYFLEPLGVSVDKWSMGVRGRSRTYSFADVFGSYENTIAPLLRTSLGTTSDCTTIIGLVNTSLGAGRLPPAADFPKYTDVQRIFNKSCIECHGGLDYPPYVDYGSTLNLAENETLPAVESPMRRPYRVAEPRAMSLVGPIFRFITRTGENCPPGGTDMMPCGGPPLSQADVDTIRRWIVGGHLYTEGDPHIRTIDGVHYDFQSAGEFVLLRDEVLEIQARQTAVDTDAPLGPNSHTGLSSCVSINTAVAVRVGPHRITYQPNLSGRPDPEGLQLRIDGKLTAMSAEIRLAQGGRIIRTTADHGIQIESPGGTTIAITPNWWAHRSLWYMNINVERARATDGVMGSIAPGNWLPALPDGTQLGPRPASLHQRYVDLYEKFEDAWRVRDTTTLFDYAPGDSTATFTIAKWPEENPTRCTVPGPGSIPPLPPLQREVAEKHCDGIVDKARRANCIVDVMATAEPGFAKTYLLTEAIERNEPPEPPELGLPADRTEVAGTMTFTWNTTKDVNGDAVTYRQCVWPVGKNFTLNDCDLKPIRVDVKSVKVSKTMKTTPSGQELQPGQSYFWKVIAEDGKGGSTESETRRVTIVK